MRRLRQLLKNPRDVETLELNAEGIQRVVRSAVDVTIVADPEIARGGCKVETDAGVIDACIATQLARIEQELVGSNAPRRLPTPVAPG